MAILFTRQRQRSLCWGVVSHSGARTVQPVEQGPAEEKGRVGHGFDVVLAGSRVRDQCPVQR